MNGSQEFSLLIVVGRILRLGLHNRSENLAGGERDSLLPANDAARTPAR